MVSFHFAKSCECLMLRYSCKALTNSCMFFFFSKAFWGFRVQSALYMQSVAIKWQSLSNNCFCLLSYATTLFSPNCWFRVNFMQDKQCQFCRAICSFCCFADHRGTCFAVTLWWEVETPRGEGRNRQQQLQQCHLGLEKILPQLRCMYNLCHLFYMQVFKTRQDAATTVSLAGALGTALCDCRVGQGGGFRGRWLKLQ